MVNQVPMQPMAKNSVPQVASPGALQTTPQTMPLEPIKKKGWMKWLIIALVLIVVGLGFYFWLFP